MKTDKVCVVLVDLAPYHIARLKAASDMGEVCVLDVGQDVSTAYETPTEIFPWLRRIPLNELCCNLEMLNPSALFVPGWAGRVARLALSWAVTNRIPVIVFSDSQLFGYRHHYLKDFIKRRVINCFSSGFVAGRRARKFLEFYGMCTNRIFEGVDVVDNQHFSKYNLLTETELEAHRLKLGLPSRYCLAVNRFVEQKNLRGLVGEFAEYIHQGHVGCLKLLIAGAGELLPDIERFIENEGISEHVHLLGRVSYDELPILYRLADAFVMASNSHSETWGLAINEAMAAACPVVASSYCGASDDLVDDGINGYVFDPFCPGELSAIFQKIGGNPEVLSGMGECAAELVALWDTNLFKLSFWQCVNHSLSRPAKPSCLDRYIVRFLSLIT